MRSACLLNAAFFLILAMTALLPAKAELQQGDTVINPTAGDTYTIVKDIQRGSEGQSIIYLAAQSSPLTETTKNKMFAIKVTTYVSDSLRDSHHTLEECIQKKNIPHCPTRFLPPIALWFNDQENANYQVTPYQPCNDFFDVLLDLPPQDNAKLLFQLVDSIALMHQHKLAHRDIKLENLLIPTNTIKGNTYRRAVLIDFDFVHLFDSCDEVLPLDKGTFFYFNYYCQMGLQHQYFQTDKVIISPLLQDIDGITLLTLYLLNKGFPFECAENPFDVNAAEHYYYKRIEMLIAWHTPIYKKSKCLLKQRLQQSVILGGGLNKCSDEFFDFLVSLHIGEFNAYTVTFTSLKTALKNAAVFRPFLPFSEALRTYTTPGTEPEKRICYLVKGKYLMAYEEHWEKTLVLIASAYEKLTGFILTPDDLKNIARQYAYHEKAQQGIARMNSKQQFLSILQQALNINFALSSGLDCDTDYHGEKWQANWPEFAAHPKSKGIPFKRKAQCPTVIITQEGEHYQVTIEHPERMGTFY